MNLFALIGLFSIAYALHEAEEWWILGWYRRNFIDLPPDKTDATIRFFLLLNIALGFVWCGVAALTGRPTVALLVLLPLLTVALLNVWQHLVWLVRFREYAPGVASAVLLLLPACVLLLRRGVQLNAIPVWLPALVLVLTLPGLLQTLRADRRQTPMFRAIHRFSVWALARLGKQPDPAGS